MSLKRTANEISADLDAIMKEQESRDEKHRTETEIYMDRYDELMEELKAAD